MRALIVAFVAVMSLEAFGGAAHPSNLAALGCTAINLGDELLITCDRSKTLSFSELAQATGAMPGDWSAKKYPNTASEEVLMIAMSEAIEDAYAQPGIERLRVVGNLISSDSDGYKGSLSLTCTRALSQMIEGKHFNPLKLLTMGAHPSPQFTASFGIN
jgi:hypothetical protein